MMKCTHLNLYLYSAPFKRAVKTALVTMTERKVLVIGVIIDDREYFAEVNSFETPWYHYETIASSITNCQRIFSRLKDKDIAAIEELQIYLDDKAPNASSAFDYIGVQYFQQLRPVTVPIGQTLHQGVTSFRDDAKRIKLKMHDDILSQVQSIRQSSAVPIVIDANGTLERQHFDLLKALDDYQILYFEEPFADILLYEQFLRKYPDVPLAIDEHATSPEAIQAFHDIGVGTAVIKYSRIGGITSALNLDGAMTYISGGMYEYGLSKYATAMLGQHFGTIPDVTPRGTYFDDDFSHYDERVADGVLYMTMPTVDRKKLTLLTS